MFTTRGHEDIFVKRLAENQMNDLLWSNVEDLNTLIFIQVLYTTLFGFHSM